MAISTELRKSIRSSGIPLARIAERAHVSVTTLHSFVRKDGAEMRASTFERVASAFAELKAGIGDSKPSRNVREDATAFADAARLNISIAVPAFLQNDIKMLAIDAETIAREGALRALKEAASAAWLETNREAIEQNRRHIEKHGTFAEQMGLI